MNRSALVVVFFMLFSSLVLAQCDYCSIRNLECPENVIAGQSFIISFEFYGTGTSFPYESRSLWQGNTKLDCHYGIDKPDCTWNSDTFIATAPTKAGTYTYSVNCYGAASSNSAYCNYAPDDSKSCTVNVISAAMPATTTGIDVTYPNTYGIKFCQGKTYRITWTSTYGLFCVNLYKGGPQVRSLDCGISNKYLDWQVPASEQTGTDYQIGVCRDDFIGCSQDDYSDNYFSIVSSTDVYCTGGGTCNSDSDCSSGYRCDISGTTCSCVEGYRPGTCEASDGTPPTVGAITPTTATSSVAQSFSASVSDNVNVESCSIYIDGYSTDVTVTVPSSCGSSGCTASWSYTFYSTGNREMKLRCRDAAWNYGEKTTTITVSAPPACSNTACGQANTILPCTCGSVYATSTNPWCCAAGNAIAATQAACRLNPACATPPPPACTDTACGQANTVVPCTCGSTPTTAASPWCCAADNAIAATQAACRLNTACAGATCTPPQTRPHSECVGTTCTSLDSCGVDSCTTNADCAIPPPPPPTCPTGQTRPHSECVAGVCTSVDTCGISDCAACTGTCTPPQTRPHSECVAGVCTSVDTCGISDCVACLGATCDSTHYIECLKAYNFASAGGTKSDMCGIQYYKIDILAGKKCDLTWTVTPGPGADYDLYTKSGACPSKTSYDCMSANSEGADKCEHKGLQTGTYYAYVWDYGKTGEYEITAAVTNCVDFTVCHQCSNAVDMGSLVSGTSINKDTCSLSVTQMGDWLKFKASESGKATVKIKPSSTGTFAVHVYDDCDGKSECSASGSGEKSCTFNAAKDKRYYIIVLYSEGTGGNVNVEVSLAADNEPPKVRVTGAPVRWQNSDAEAKISCEDSSGCNVDSYKLKIYSEKKNCPTIYENYDKAVPQMISSYSFMCGAAKDSFGNFANSTATEFKIDKEKPVVSVSHSTEETDEGTNVTIKATSSDKDSGINRTEIYVDGSLKNNCTTAGCIFEDTFAVGDYKYYAIAVDNAGNSNKTAEGSFTIEGELELDCEKASIDILTVFVTLKTETATLIVHNNGDSNDMTITSAYLYTDGGGSFSATGLPIRDFDVGEMENIDFSELDVDNCDAFSKLEIKTSCDSVSATVTATSNKISCVEEKPNTEIELDTVSHDGSKVYVSLKNIGDEAVSGRFLVFTIDGEEQKCLPNFAIQPDGKVQCQIFDYLCYPTKPMKAVGAISITKTLKVVGPVNTDEQEFECKEQIETIISICEDAICANEIQTAEQGQTIYIGAQTTADTIKSITLENPNGELYSISLGSPIKLDSSGYYTVIVEAEKDGSTVTERKSFSVNEAEATGDGLIYFLVVILVIILLGFLYFRKRTEEARVKKILRRTRR